MSFVNPPSFPDTLHPDEKTVLDPGQAVDQAFPRQPQRPPQFLVSSRWGVRDVSWRR